MRQKAFTLIELLVVIAIIAILAAILFPVFAQAREKARAIACLSNTKQLALGVTQYEQDYDEKTPNGDNPYGGAQGWAGEIYPYVKSTGVFICPDDATSNKEGQGATAHGTSYCYNSQVSIAAPGFVGSPDSVTLSAYNSPAKTVLLCELVNSESYDVSRGNQYGDNVTAAWGDDYPPYLGGSPAGYGIGGAYDPNGADGNGGNAGGQSYTIKYATGYLRNTRTGAALGDFANAAGRHTGGANYVMADGHAKFFRPSAVSGGYLNTTAGNCGKSDANNPIAAATDCSDTTIAATFNLQ